MIQKSLLHIFIIIFPFFLHANLPLVFFTPQKATISNFGDELSPIIIERILQHKISHNIDKGQRLLAIGSILHFAHDNDVIWGSGINGKIASKHYKFTSLDVRAVRGPLTRDFLRSKGIACPKIYGDPALLMPILFPELKAHPTTDYIVIPNLNEILEFKKFPNLVLPTEECMTVVNKILHAKFVISGSLHGIIVAEAFGIPARLLKITAKEHIIKYQDYYYGTGRRNFRIAHSLEEALKLGGETKPVIDLHLLLGSFPYDKF